MNSFTIERVLALPGTLLPSTMYIVKGTDPGLADIYFTNTDATEIRHIISKSDILGLIADAIGGFSTTIIVNTIAERDALTLTTNTMVMVLDATGDVTVTSGAATYVFSAFNTTWYKIAEYESLDLVVSWSALQDKPASSITDIDLAVTQKHTHANQAVLDTLAVDQTNKLLHNSNPLAYLSDFASIDLSSKADVVHSHAVSDITGLQTTLTALQDGLTGGATVPTIDGPASTSVGLATLFTITNYDTTTTYTLSVTNGTISRSGNIITYTPSALGSGGFTINGRSVPVTIVTASIITPAIVSPAMGATGLTASVSLAGSPFITNPDSYESHDSTDWQIATDSGFTTIVASTSSNVNKTNWTASLPGSALGNVTLYARVRYKSATLTSEWSPTISFITTDLIIAKPIIFSPTQFASSIPSGLTVQVSGFTVTPYTYNTHVSTDWQIATDSDFTTLVLSSTGNTTSLYSWTVLLPQSTENTTLYIRVRFNGNTLTSAWSETRTVTTKVLYAPSHEQAVIIAADRAATDNFGYAVSLDGDGSRVVIGALNDDTTQPNDGSVYIWIRSGTTWTQEAKLVGSAPYNTANFGNSVAISTDSTRLIVGAPRADGSYGAAYVFVRDGSTWTQEVMVTGVAYPTSYFGTSVDINADGTRVVIGQPDYQTVGNYGAVYVYRRTNTVWALETQKITAGGLEKMGTSVSIDATGTRFIAGAPDVSSPVSKCGAVYVFSRSGTTWTQEAKLTVSDRQVSDYFGISVSINANGDRFVAGNNDALGSRNGKAYTFTRSGTTWTQETIFNPPDPITSGYYGWSVSLSDDGTVLLIGAKGKRASYTYYLNNGVWALEAERYGSVTATLSLYGGSVGVSGDGFYGAVGANNLTIGGTTNAGACFIFN